MKNQLVENQKQWRESRVEVHFQIITYLEESLDTSGEVVTINQMSLQDLVSQIEIEVSNESSNNWVVTRMRERSHGDGNNSAKYLSLYH